MDGALERGFQLDRQWHRMRGEMEQSKKPALLLLGRILAEARLPYAIIGGLAVQAHQEEPRTTLDIDLAVTDREQVPRDSLAAAGFTPVGSFAHSENWMGPGSTPVQFTDDPGLHEAIRRAVVIPIEGVGLRFLAVADLLHEKLRAGGDPARRRSKRLQDLGDAQALLERYPELLAELSAAERALLARLP